MLRNDNKHGQPLSGGVPSVGMQLFFGSLAGSSARNGPEMEPCEQHPTEAGKVCLSFLFLGRAGIVNPCKQQTY